MTTDFRALCAELAGWIERSTRHYIQDPDVLIRARAALAEPEPRVAEPTYSEVLAIRDELDANGYGTVDLVAFARAVLARWGHQPASPAKGEVAEGPTYDDLSELCSEHGLDVNSWPLDKFEALWKVARAVLARWGNQPAPPAEGEVAELVAQIRHFLAGYRQMRGLDPEHIYSIHRGDAMEAHITVSGLTRAADLLEQRHPAPVPVAEPEPEAVGPTDEELLETLDKATADFPPRHPEAESLNAVEYPLALELRKARAVLARYGHHPAPVPVAERLPGPEDCLPWPGEPNAGRWCWMASFVDNGWAWEQRTLGFLASFPQDFTHWLPATALPLPQGEVQP